METQDIKSQFEQILDDVKNISGLSEESATKVATVILQEAGKDRRTEILTLDKSRSASISRSSCQPATFKQKNALKRFGISFSDELTKSGASELIDKAIEQSNSR